MPGRHAGGPLGGGSRGGGGFRSGGFGGYPRGGGWGGPRRPMYGGGWGWGWRPRPFFGGGWLFPMMFGPRFGFGGFGCGGIGCVLMLGMLFIFMCIGSSFSSQYAVPNSGYDPRYNGPVSGQNNNVDNSQDSGAPQLSNETSAVQTQTARDMDELHTAFDSRISEWQSQLANNEEKSIPPQDAGLNRDNNTKAVLYGKCGSAFYIYVVLSTTPNSSTANGEGYVYTTANSPGSCHPKEWTVDEAEDVSGGWYFVTLKST